MISPEIVERTQQYLFASEEEMVAAKLPEKVRTRLKRLRDMYVFWLNTPQLVDKAIVTEMQRRYHIGLSVAYEDVRLIKLCLGNLNQATTDYYRYLFLQRAEEAFQMARDKNDPKSFAAVLATLGKYTKLDQEEQVGPDYESIQVQTFEITSDPTASGFARIPNVEEVAKKMLARYSKETAQAMDVEEIKVEPIGTPMQPKKE